MRIKIPILLLLILFRTSAFGAVAYDNSGSLTGVGVTSLTISSFVVAATNPLILCGAGEGGTVGASTSGVTYNAVSMTQVGTPLVQGGSDNSLSMWRLTGQSGTHNATATYSTTVDTATFGCMSFTGAHQTTPVGTRQDSTAYDATPISLTIPANGLGADFVMAQNATPGCDDLVPVGSHTERFDACADNGAGNSEQIAASTGTSSGAFEWSGPSGAYAFQLGVPINEATTAAAIVNRRRQQ